MRGTADGQVAPPAAMGLHAQIGAIEIVVTADAELVFVTFIAELRVSARRDRMGDGELGAVHVGHGVAEFPHFVSTTGLVALKAEILLMTGRAINGLGHRSFAVRQ